jgi:acyl-CoA dehydrogenase
MNFEDTPEEAAFRAEARAFLQKAGVPYRQAPSVPWTDETLTRAATDWQRAKADAGFAAILWPREFGGRAGTPMEQIIFSQEESAYHIPTGAFIRIGVNLAGPTIMRWGTDEQKQRLLAPTRRGELYWCQLFSEPSAGSDLAGLRTRATRDGNDWIINGQKVWTSWAHVADYGLLIARNDPSLPKHKGLTFFLVDMKNTPGLVIRGIRQINGKSEFNEVFLEDVRIPDSMRLGPVGEGWKVVMTTLSNERLSIGAFGDELDIGKVMELARRRSGADGRRVIEDSAFRLKAADIYMREQGMRHFRARLLTQISRGGQPGAEAALGKLVFGLTLQETASLAMEIQGLDGVVEQPGGLQHAIHENFLTAAALRIAGGTDEILRTQLGEHVLGLPADMRVDKGVPFDRVPTGF